MKNRKDGPMLRIVSAVTIFSILIYGLTGGFTHARGSVYTATDSIMESN